MNYLNINYYYNKIKFPKKILKNLNKSKKILKKFNKKTKNSQNKKINNNKFFQSEIS